MDLVKKNRVKKLIGVSVLCFIVSIYFMSEVSVSKEGAQDIWINITRPVMLEFPFELVEIGINGEKGLSIAPHAGRGWKGEAGGTVTYNFYVPDDGEYTLWAYCLWHDECTNAIYAQIDDSDKAIIGNDPVFDSWHWVRGFTINLKRGLRTLKLSNHSDNVSVQKIFLTNVPDRTPSKEMASVTNLFLDTFNGCDKGNFPLWDKRKGSWKVEKREHQADADNCLVGTSDSESLLVLDKWNWNNFVLSISIKSPIKNKGSGKVGICFGLKNDEEYFQLCWSEPPSGNKAKMELIHHHRGAAEMLATCEVPWQVGRWHELELDLGPMGVQITIDGGIKHFMQVSEEIEGGIGLWLSGDIESRFDDVHVWKRTTKRLTK